MLWNLNIGLIVFIANYPLSIPVLIYKVECLYVCVCELSSESICLFVTDKLDSSY